MSAEGIIGLLFAAAFIYFAFKERWGMAVGMIFVCAFGLYVVNEPDETLFPLGEYLWNSALETVGLR